MKNIILIIFVFLSCPLFGQYEKASFRAEWVTFAKSPTWEWSEWKEVDILITMSANMKRLRIYNSGDWTIDIINEWTKDDTYKSYDSDPEGYTQWNAYGVDDKDNLVDIKIKIYNDDIIHLYVYYQDIFFSYQANRI